VATVIGYGITVLLIGYNGRLWNASNFSQAGRDLLLSTCTVRADKLRSLYRVSNGPEAETG
jgi:hypothetical protein